MSDIYTGVSDIYTCTGVSVIHIYTCTGVSPTIYYLTNVKLYDT